MSDETFESRVTPLLEAQLQPGETLRGVAASTYQKTFSGWMVAIGTTDRRLILLGLDRKWQPKGPPQTVSDPAALAAAELDGAGDGWWTTSAAIADWHSLILRVRTDDGEKTKLTLTRGGMKLLGGERQEAGVAALTELLAAARVVTDVTTVAGYLAALDDDRRATIDAVRDVILANLPAGYEESFRWGMLSYEVPLHRYPDTYNGKPLMYAALAAQQRYSSLYLTSVYSDPGKLERFVDAYRATGKRLDMGKSCVRFRTLDDLPLDLVADVIRATKLDKFVAAYEASRTR